MNYRLQASPSGARNLASSASPSASAAKSLTSRSTGSHRCAVSDARLPKTREAVESPPRKLCVPDTLSAARENSHARFSFRSINLLSLPLRTVRFYRDVP